MMAAGRMVVSGAAPGGAGAWRVISLADHGCAARMYR